MRDQLLAALRVRIESAARTQDAADVRTEQALADAEALLPHLVNADAEVDLEIAHLLGLFHGARASLPGNDATTDTRWALTLLYVLYLDQPDAVPEPMRSSWAVDRLPAAVALHQVTRRLRAAAPTQPWLWAGYVHSGA
jgi:hypothetical protein